MIRLQTLASGSRGNCTLVSGFGTHILVDAGLSGKELTRRLELVGYRPEQLAGIVLTHEHGDHVRGAGVLARRFGLQVYSNQATLEAARRFLGELPDHRAFRTSHPFRLGEMTIHPFPISHDAADPVGLVIEIEGGRIGFCQDCGFVTRLVRERLRGVDALVLECNHDVGMLTSGPYPWSTKQRIRSRQGHLSNEEGARLLGELAHAGLQGVLLSHLSETNNHPELALLAVRDTCRTLGLPENLCRMTYQDRPSEPLEIRPHSDGDGTSSAA